MHDSHIQFPVIFIFTMYPLAQPENIYSSVHIVLYVLDENIQMMLFNFENNTTTDNCKLCAARTMDFGAHLFR